MAHDILYVNPQSEIQRYTFDFAPDLTGDTSLVAIGAGASTITAYEYDGTDVSATILATKTISGMTMYVNIGSVTQGEEYKIEFVAKGTQTGLFVTKVLEVRARNNISGAF